MLGCVQAQADGSGPAGGAPQSARHRRAHAVQTQDLASSVAAVRSAGDLFPGDKLAAMLMQVSFVMVCLPAAEQML